MATATKAKKGTVQTMSFYTLGDGFTNLVRMFIEEGSFLKVYEILKDGGLPQEAIKKFFLYELKFDGDSRTKEGLYTVTDNEKYDLPEIYTTAIATCLAKHKDNLNGLWEWRTALDKNFEDCYSEDFACLHTILTAEEIRDLSAVKILERYKYNVKRDNKRDKHGDLESDGAILHDGSYVVCGFQQHINLFPVLFQLGLANSSDWINDSMVIHVSSGQISGACANCLTHPREYWRNEANITEAQVKSLFYFKDHIKGEYGGIRSKSTAELVRCYIEYRENHGGKYNNLAFLREFYPNITLPKFSKEKMDGKVCIRTSPKYSIAGLLESKFNITENSVKEIEKEFKDAVKLLGKDGKDNELHYFYQEYLDGGNGVCHYWEKGNFKYAYSEKRGDIVKGVKSNKKLPAEIKKQLSKIAENLFIDLENPVQLEFVVQDGKLYIVQLRLLKNNPNNTVTYKPQGKILVKGQTFSTGSEYGDGTDSITLSDILIVDSDADSKALIGKKALIVKSNVEFSHVLALSKTLGIPSMYGTGEFDLKKLEGKKLNFCAKNTEAWITYSTKK